MHVSNLRGPSECEANEQLTRGTVIQLRKTVSLGWATPPALQNQPCACSDGSSLQAAR